MKLQMSLTKYSIRCIIKLQIAKFTCVRAYDSYFAMMLRERISATLAIMQDDALDVEAHMTTTGKIKHR